MSFVVPEHVRPLREKVRRFIEDRIYPVESTLDERRDGDAQAAMRRLMREAKEAGLWAFGHPKEIGSHGLPVLRIYDGPDEVHQMTVARRLLREYRNGKQWDFGLEGLRPASLLWAAPAGR